MLLATIVSLSTASHAATIIPDGTQLIHAWQIQSIEIMGVATTPDATMAGDMLDLNPDNTFTAVIDGNALSGTYGIDPSNTWITLYITADSAMRIKVIMLDGLQMKTDRVDGDGNHTIVTYLQVD
jgi:hypothetical protein